jgi:probable poly-beta-1,6-N-acetyl-D-glucosamine export protein
MMRWYSEINQLRGLAILAVVSVHISDVFTKMDLSLLALLYMLIDSFSLFALPCFIFISGFVLYNKYHTPFDKNRSIEFYKKHLIFLLIPYVVFSTVYLIFNQFLPDATPLTCQKVLLAYMTGSACFHLWFFILIAQLYLLYPLILNTYLRYSDNKKCLYGALFICYICSVAFFMQKGEDFPYALRIISFVGYLVFFLVGMETTKQYERFQSKKFLYSFRFLTGLFIAILVLLIPHILYYITWYFPSSGIPVSTNIMFWINPVLDMAITIFFILLLRSIPSPSRGLRFLDIMGIYAFGIYLVHPLFLTSFAAIMGENLVSFAGQILYYPFMMILAIGLSLLLCKAIEKIPYGRIIIGTKNKDKIKV